MGTQRNTGFTVIETMLFLAIAGALAAGVLVGSGVAVNQQRYRDSVNTLKSYIQQQYSHVSNVVNDRAGAEACANAIVAQPSDSITAQPRGTSECIMLGRYIVIDDSGTRAVASNVVGYRTSNAAEADNDIAELQSHYQLGTSTIGQETLDVPWGATIVQSGTSNKMKLALLILRSPLSGSIMTYSTEDTETGLLDMIDVDNSNVTRNLCLDTTNGVINGRRTAVQISPFATSQGAIQVPPESANVCG